MKKTITILALVLCSFQNFKIVAQTDTLYWFAAPWVTPDSWWRDNLGFHISTYSNTTTVRIKQPASVFDTVVVIPPYTSFDKYFNYMIDSLENKPADKVLYHGFRISSDFPISVVYDELSRSPNFFNTETYSCKGKAALGTNFITPFQTTYSIQPMSGDLNGDLSVTQSYSQFNIVASENNTTVWITPKCNITGHLAGVTYSVFLPSKGMTYTGQDVSQQIYLAANNLSGTKIISDKPIAVTVSDDSIKPGGGGCYDLIGDQIVPVENTGTDYIVNKGYMFVASNESIFIVGTQNSTTVTIDDGFSVNTLTLNATDTRTFVLTQPLTYVQSSDNVYLYHVSGYGCETGSELLPPLTCFGGDQITFARIKTDPYLLNIYCKNGAQSTFTLDGSTTLVPASAFSVVPGTAGNFVGAQISYSTSGIAVGTHTISNSGNPFGFGIINGNFGNGVSYHYMNEFPAIPTLSAGVSQTICANTNTIALNGTISNGNSIWTTNGTGTFSAPGSLNTTYSLSISDISQPQLTFYLTAANCAMTGDSVQLIINPVPFAFFALTSNTFCLNSGTVNLMASPPGGVYSGSMVTSGGVFNPAAVGVFTVGYTSTYSTTGCSSTATETLTVNSCTGIKNSALDELKVYPNPVTDIIKIEGQQGINYTITVFDMTGKIALSKVTFTGSSQVLLEKLNSGIYYLKINTGKAEKYVKLIKL
jgi:hypothetical protein